VSIPTDPETTPSDASPEGEPEMEITIEKITPEVAADYLQLNVENRKLHEKTVERFARAMRAGRWKLTTQGIAFDIDGRLVDGQHRLAACILIDEPFETLVFRNAPRDMFDVLDDGKHRSGADTLGILGSSNRSHCASALRLLKAYAIAQREKRLTLFHAVRQTRIENWELEPWFAAYPQVQDWASAGMNVHRHTRCLPSGSAVIATLFLASRIEPEKTQSFVDAVVSMEGLEAGSAPLILVRREPIVERGHDGQTMTMITLSKALKNWFAGSKAQRLIVPPLANVPELGWLPFPDTLNPGNGSNGNGSNGNEATK
jgi:hypothetical protein